MATLLAVDTSTELCSVALSHAGRIWLSEQDQPRRHTELLLPMIQQVLDQAAVELKDLDAVAFGRGPGSFTGLRIALGVVQGLAFACDLPVVPVSTLAALAQQGADANLGSRFLCALDARMGEVYWGKYQRNADGLVEPVADEQLLAPSAVSLPSATDWVALGTGWAVDGMPVWPGADTGLRPSAKGMLALASRDLQLGKTVAAQDAAPVYLRNQVAHKAGS